MIGFVEKNNYEIKVDVQNSKSESQRIREHLQRYMLDIRR